MSVGNSRKLNQNESQGKKEEEYVYSGHKEQHVLQKVLKHKRMWCGGKKNMEGQHDWNKVS